MRLSTSTIAIALFAGALTLSSTAGAARTVDDCRTLDMKIVGSSRENSTSSISLVPIPDMAVLFRQGKRGCIVVEMQAFGFATGSEIINLDAELDGDNSHLGGQELQFVTNHASFGLDRMIRFIWVDVPAGNHKVQLFYRSGTGGTVNLRTPNMIVHYTK